jgi:catechol 2,3-dioxygenase-like lactoylglutathione lyase family enzyme
MPIPARMSIVTLGVEDLARSKAFYEALGWQLASSSVEGVIYWFRTAETYLGLHPYEELAEDGRIPLGSREGFRGVTFAINLESDNAVVAAFDAALAAGATPLKAPEQAIFGGLSAYFADPDGYAWEVAHNPSFPIGDDGRITIP